MQALPPGAKPRYNPAVVLNFLFCAFGMVIGSYLNVVIHRLPRGISTVLPRSRCPRCRAPIHAWDNVPVLSYLLLRGHCRHCGGAISWRYPAVELATGLCFVASLRLVGGTPFEIAVSCAFSSAMIALAMIDLDHYILPDAITLPGIAVGLALQPWLTDSPWPTWPSALLGALAGGVLIYAAGWLWERLRGVWGMGVGDAKMLAMIGAFQGVQGAAFTLFLSSLAGAVVGVSLLATRKMSTGSKLPFGVFLGPSALIFLFFGRRIVLAIYGW